MNAEQARRTGYGEGVRAAAKLADDAGRPALAEEIRGLQSTTERAATQPAGEAPAIVGSIGDDAEFRRLLEHVIQARHGGGWGEAFTAFTGFIDTIIQGARNEQR